MFALISINNQVAQIADSEFPVAPPLVWIDISSASPAPAPGWSYSGGTFTAPAASPAPTLVQQAQAALFAGVAITSTGTPALNGTYAVDSITQHKIAAVSVYILVNSKFPGGASSYAWPDVSGALHNFPSTAEWQSFATAVADYVAELDLIIVTGTGSLPAAPPPLP